MHQKPITDKRTAQTPEPQDMHLVTQAVIDLHVGRRTLLIYPLSHEQVKRSIVKAFNSLSVVLAQSSEVALTVMKEGIGIGGQVLDTKSSVLKDLSAVLKHYRIVMVTFQKRMEIKELANFLRLLTYDLDKIMEKGGFEEIIAGRHFPSIGIQTVDYSRLQVTEEQEIHRSSAQDMGEGSVWQQFVSHLEANRKVQINSSSMPTSPEHLAEMLNQKVLDGGQVVEAYRDIVTNAAEQGPGTGHKNLAEELRSFQKMIKELDPGLKEQFLSATFDNCAQLATVSDAAHLIDGLGGDLIIQMLRHASAEGKKISPSLLSFINKMGHADGLPAAQGGSSMVANKPAGFSSDNVESLLAHEQYDTYVDSDYGKLLNRLSRETQQQGQHDDLKSLAHEIEEGLTGAGILSHAGRAIVRLMTGSTDISGYRDWARQLAYLLDDLLDHRAYGFLTRLMKFIRRVKKREDEERSEIAKLVLSRFSDPQFVAKAIESVQASMGEADPEALVFLIELGEPVVVEIFDGIDPYHSFHEQGVLNQILRNLASLTAQEALERIKDPRPDYVIKMIRIIRTMGDSDSAQQIKSLIDHEDPKVRAEALATLLEFKNKWGLVRLRELLCDPLDDFFATAAELAGRYRVRSVVPQLEAIAAQRSEYDPREPAIRALGQIGDPVVIPTLSQIAHRRWSMAKKQTLHLKRVVFDTLGGYPMEAVHELLRHGVRHKDEAIRTACERLFKKSANKSDTGKDHTKQQTRT